jgi:hypothetical protein
MAAVRVAAFYPHVRSKSMRLPFICTALLLGAVAAPAATLNDLYFGLDNMRGFSEVYWWFLADGRVLNALPTHGLTPADFDAACSAHTGFCGNYTLNGDKLSIHYKNGSTQDWTFKPLNGGIQLNYLILTPVQKFPAGAKLNGTWSRPFSSTVASGPSSAVTVTAPTFYTFRSDGTYSQNTVAGVDAVSGVKGANIADSQNFKAQGAYTVKDNVLTLGGARHMIFPVAGDNLNIDGMVYTKQK